MKKLKKLFRYSGIKKLFLIMRITLFLLIASLVQVSASVYSQNTKLNVDIKSASFEDILDEIKDQSEFNFLYRSDIFEGLTEFDLKFSEVTLETILDKVLVPEGYEYEIDDNVVVIRKARESIRLVPNTNEQQTKTIKGKVVDGEGNPLPGATVLEEGTTNGTTTNVEGEFSLDLKGNEPIISISFIGFLTQQINVDDKTNFEIVLEESTTNLGEVMVTSGYSKIAKERATGSFFQVKEEQLEEQVTTNISDRLEGITTGLLFTTKNGDGGNSSKITIRGTNAFHTETSPLIVVDGFPIEGSFESINPNDVESITILQDAAAASIWGVQSAGGVIVITTKSGRKGKLDVEYSSYFTMESRTNLDNLQMASSTALVDFISEAIEKGSDKSFINRESNAINATQQVYADYATFDENTGEFLSISREGLLELETLRNTDVFDQYSDLMLRNALSSQHNLSVRGGGDISRFYFSTSYNNNKSVEIGDMDERLSIMLNNDINLAKNLRLHLGANIVFQNAQNNAEGLGIIQGFNTGRRGLPRFQLLVDEDGNRARVPFQIPEETKRYYEDLGYLDWSYNPLNEIDNRDAVNKNVTTRLKFGLDWQIVPALSWETKGQYESIITNNADHRNMNMYYTRNLINRYTTIGDDGELLHGIPMGGILHSTKANTKSYTLRSQFNYDKVFATDHRITALGGMEARDIETNGTFNTYYGYDENTLLFDVSMDWSDPKSKKLYNGSDGYLTNDDKITNTKYRYISSFANAAYTFKSRYTLTLSGKIDQTSFFGTNARLRANPLWSAGGAWLISEESFFETSFVDMLKLRLSYGVNGNAQKGAVVYTTLERYYDRTYKGNANRIDGYGNPDIKHEDTYTFNAAIDFSLFDYKLNGSLEFYNRKSENLVANFKINPIYGFTNQYKNNGEISNKGIALNLNSNLIQTKGFTWDADLNLTYNNNKVVTYDNPNDENTIWVVRNTGESYNAGLGNLNYIIGEDMSSILALRWAGLSEDGTPQVYNENDEIIGYETVINDKNIFINAGKTNPPVYGGFTNTFRYKNLSLSVLLTYKFGHVFRRPGGSVDWYTSQTAFQKAEFHEDIKNRWQNPGDEEITDVPRIPDSDIIGSYEAISNYSNFYRFSDLLVEDASYIKIRQVSLAYALQKETLNKIKIPFEQLRFTAQVRNLGMLWTANKYNIDPDVIPFRGGVLSSSLADLEVSRPGYKPQPVYTFGLNIMF